MLCIAKTLKASRHPSGRCCRTSHHKPRSLVRAPVANTGSRLPRDELITSSTSEVAAPWIQRFREVIGALTQFVEQPRVLDGDGRLVCKGAGSVPREARFISRTGELHHARWITLTQQRHAHEIRIFPTDAAADSAYSGSVVTSAICYVGTVSRRVRPAGTMSRPGLNDRVRTSAFHSGFKAYFDFTRVNFFLACCDAGHNRPRRASLQSQPTRPPRAAGRKSNG